MTDIAPADLLLGQLQRGAGRGFLRALQEDVTVITPLLFDCVIHDPRWDRQLESRSDYYAVLILQFALSLDPFDTCLRAYAENDSEDATDAEYAVLDTICSLAVRGDVSAIAIVRAYLTYGHHWGMAFETLMEVSDTSLSVDEASRIIDQRFPDDDTLDDELFSVGPLLSYAQQEPWRSLRFVNPRVNRIMSEREMKVGQWRQQMEPVQARFANLPITELFTVAIDNDTTRFAVQALQERVTTADLDLLLHMAQQGDHRQRFVAFRGLQRLAHPAALPILQAFFESPNALPGRLYGAAARAIVALPSHITLDLARSWFDTSEGLCLHVALQILEAHATVTDVGRIRAAILPSLERNTREMNECYMQCGMLKILARFPQSGPYPEAETVFNEAGYAPIRSYAAQVLAVCNPDQFAHGLALECLWDCEKRVRLIGCERVSLDVLDAYAKLQTMSYDPHEDEKVRKAAKGHLIVGKSDICQ